MLDARYQQARQTIARKPQILEQIASARRHAQRHRDDRCAHGQGPAGKLGEQERGAASARASSRTRSPRRSGSCRARSEHERLTGQRYTPRQIADARAAVERELATPPDERDYEQLAYRLPGGRDAYQAASEPGETR